MEAIALGIIGGSRVYNLDKVEIIDEIDLDTPFGKPSDKFTIGKIGPRKAVFLPRHGKGHRLLPTEVPSQANIWGMKKLGVRKIISVSAVGSLQEEIRPTDWVLPDQIIDKTKFRKDTFFGNGIAGHVSFAEPFCETTRKQVKDIIRSYFTSQEPDKRLFDKGTYVCMEGPAFSTKAESHLHREWGAGVIGMTVAPEAKLAREAEICYVTIALATDYDCWKEEEEAVGVSMVVEYMKENSRSVNEILPLIIQQLPLEQTCACSEAGRHAVMTSPECLDKTVKERLEIFYGKYWK